MRRRQDRGMFSVLRPIDETKVVVDHSMSKGRIEDHRLVEALLRQFNVLEETDELRPRTPEVNDVRGDVQRKGPIRLAAIWTKPVWDPSLQRDLDVEPQPTQMPVFDPAKSTPRLPDGRGDGPIPKKALPVPVLEEVLDVGGRFDRIVLPGQQDRIVSCRASVN